MTPSLARVLALASACVAAGWGCVSSDFVDGQFSCDVATGVGCPTGQACGADGRCRAHALSDGGAVDSADRDQSASGFCANAKHTLCLDFDDGGYGNWLPSADPTARIAVDKDASTSPPYSLVASIPGGALHASILSALPVPTAHLVCRFSFRVDAIDTSTGPTIYVVRLSASGPDTVDHVLALILDGHNNRSGLQEFWHESSGTPGNQTSSPFPLPGATGWQTVTLDASLTSDGGTAWIGIEALRFGPFSLAKGGTISELELGTSASGAAQAPVSLRFDDVACDAQTP
jgi:hypothetical protein